MRPEWEAYAMSYCISSQFNVFNTTVVFYKSVEPEKLVQFERFLCMQDSNLFCSSKALGTQCLYLYLWICVCCVLLQEFETVYFKALLKLPCYIILQ